VGCHNWSTAADDRNDENTLIIHDPTLANVYYQEFNKRFSASGGPVGLQPVEITADTWTLFPVPAREELNLRYEGTGTLEARIRIFNLNGQQIMETTSPVSPGIISLAVPSGTPSGIYLLRIEAEGRLETLKLLIE
jgi:hypothetical protein